MKNFRCLTLLANIIFLIACGDPLISEHPSTPLAPQSLQASEATNDAVPQASAEEQLASQSQPTENINPQVHEKKADEPTHHTQTTQIIPLVQYCADITNGICNRCDEGFREVPSWLYNVSYGWFGTKIESCEKCPTTNCKTCTQYECTACQDEFVLTPSQFNTAERKLAPSCKRKLAN